MKKRFSIALAGMMMAVLADSGNAAKRPCQQQKKRRWKQEPRRLRKRRFLRL